MSKDQHVFRVYCPNCQEQAVYSGIPYDKEMIVLCPNCGLDTEIISWYQKQDLNPAIAPKKHIKTFPTMQGVPEQLIFDTLFDMLGDMFPNGSVGFEANKIDNGITMLVRQDDNVLSVHAEVKNTERETRLNDYATKALELLSPYWHLDICVDSTTYKPAVFVDVRALASLHNTEFDNIKSGTEVDRLYTKLIDMIHTRGLEFDNCKPGEFYVR